MLARLSVTDPLTGVANRRRLEEVLDAEVRQHVRDTDLVARYGGEEFAVVMPGMNLDAAVAAAERLRKAVMTLPEPRDARRVVTVSIGVAAAIPPEGGAWHHLVESADAELYRAKRGGRNRVHAASRPATSA